MADVITARKGALYAAQAAIQTAKALYPSEEWGDDTTASERVIAERLSEIDHCIGDLLEAAQWVERYAGDMMRRGLTEIPDPAVKALQAAIAKAVSP